MSAPSKHKANVLHIQIESLNYPRCRGCGVEFIPVRKLMSQTMPSHCWFEAVRSSLGSLPYEVVRLTRIRDTGW